jgi:hypothetical protein
MKKVCILIAVLSIVVLFNVVCPQLAIDHHGVEFHPEGNCTFLSHSFIHMGTGLSFPTALPLIGLFLLLVTTFLLEGFVSGPFKPPRFHC